MKKFTSAVAVFAIIVATFLVYAPALRNGFVWDDTALVLRDPLIRSWRLLPECFRHFLFLDATASDFYRPLQRVTFVADYAAFGFDAPWGWHLTSILVHAAAAAALFVFARQLLTVFGVDERKAGLGAFAAALVWAIHPIHTSAVTYIAGRADPLAALFGFTALAFALRTLVAADVGTLTSHPGAQAGQSASSHVGCYVWTLAALCFFAALLSKESGIVALLIWFAVLAARRASGRTFGKWLVISAVVLGAYFVLRLSAERTPPPAPPPTALAERPVLAARAAAEYAQLLLAPAALHMERDVRLTARSTPGETRWRHTQTALGALLAAALIATGWRARRSHPAAALALAAAAVAYLPISNLFSLNATVAEHWLYVPAAFVLLAATTAALPWLARRPVFVRVIAGGGVACWVVFLGAQTAGQQAAWRDQRTFLTTTIARGGDTARMHINLAQLEANAGHFDAARAAYTAALERAPRQPIAWLGVANLGIRTRDFPTAHAALAMIPAWPLLAAETLQARAVLAHLETGADSGDLLRQAAETSPKNWPVEKRWLQYLTERGRSAEAARALTTRLHREPFRADSWRMLATLAETLGRPAEARVAYKEAARRDVRDAASRMRTHEGRMLAEMKP